MSTKDLKIERVTAVSDELLQAFSTLLPQLSTTNRSISKEHLAEILTSPATTLLIARWNGRIVGSLTLVMFRIPTALRAWIEDVVVDDSMRGKGIGEALTREAVRIAQVAEAKTIDLTSRQSRAAAHRLYEKCGFHVRETSVYRYGSK